MAYTWGEIKINSIKKMFLNNEAVSVNDLPMMSLDRKYAVYLDSMPGAANEALLRIMNISRPIIKDYSISYNAPSEIYDELNTEVHQIVNNDLIKEKELAKSYYFEVDNTCEVTIERFDTTTQDWVVLETITHTLEAEEQPRFVAYKGLIENDDNELIQIRFKADGYLYNVRYIALYTLNFRTGEEVFNNTPKQVYNLKTLVSDFYKIDSISFKDISGKKESYAVDYLIYGDGELHVDSRYKGTFVIKYVAYPDKIDNETKDNYVFTLADEMVALIPLYISSELYKDDDPSLATQYRNQFEVGIEEPARFDKPREFENNSNWL